MSSTSNQEKLSHVDKKQKTESKEPTTEGVPFVQKFGKPARVVGVGEFERENHFYTKVINSHIHPLVSYFLGLSNSRIINRFCHLYPAVSKEKLEEILSYQPKYFRWSGADLFNVTSASGGRQMVVIETNSCPSGQKSMPLMNEAEDRSGYRTLMQKTFKTYLKNVESELPKGGLAVIYDKNPMEASGYASAMADLFGEDVYLVEWYDGDKNPCLHWKDGILEIKTSDGNWVPIRAAWRYVTQRPWNRLPVTKTKTLILNPIIACLAGGRNKATASKAYDFFNAEYEQYGIAIRTPETIRDVNKNEIPLWVKSFGGHAVIKIPYSNAGQGVYTITSKAELEDFMNGPESGYDQYIVQSLIGNYAWSSQTRHGQLFHVGTFPDTQGNIYVADLRMMIHYDYKIGGYRPLAIYARRAHKPLVNTLEDGKSSWDMLGTNLSVKLSNNTWDTETNRLLLVDRRDFNRLGIGSDDLIDGFIQTVLATVAIDKLANKLMQGEKQEFDVELFSSLNKDQSLIQEILRQ